MAMEEALESVGETDRNVNIQSESDAYLPVLIDTRDWSIPWLSLANSATRTEVLKKRLN